MTVPPGAKAPATDFSAESAAGEMTPLPTLAALGFVGSPAIPVTVAVLVRRTITLGAEARTSIVDTTPIERLGRVQVTVPAA